jgi:ABC-type cobalamin/Fe3+-siderophores transport system ATPase subunit
MMDNPEKDNSQSERGDVPSAQIGSYVVGSPSTKVDDSLIALQKFLEEGIPLPTAAKALASTEIDAAEESSIENVGAIPDSTEANGDEQEPARLVPLPDSRPIRARKWSKVESITISNFKAIDETTVPLGAVTILVGPNGSGKSSILQAIHWAARAASYIAPKNGKEMMAFDRVDYLPSSEPLKTAYRNELKADKGTRPTRVSFNHSLIEGDEQAPSAVVSIYAARNRGGVTAHIEGGAAVSPYKQRSNFLTAYIPGLAGLSERETILAQPLLRRQAASGDAGGVLRNVLYNLSSPMTGDLDSSGASARLKRLNELVGEVHPDITISVSFDDREDYNISASYSLTGFPGDHRTLETAATGVLQVIQIFAYLVLFRPKIMLIDEPDAHLHPDKQERLIEALERASKEFETQIILTTHSPHIARAASPDTKLVWMNNGAVKTNDDDAIRRLLGWGGLDKDAMFFVEDEDDVAIRSLLRQWPELSRRLAICRCFGVDNLPKDKMLKGLLVDGQINMRALIHRDRDFMTDDETERWKNLYKTDGTFSWVTIGSDVEAYFCQAQHLSRLYGISVEEAETWRNEAALAVSQARDAFLEKRKVIVRILWPNGGSPNAEELWENEGKTSPDFRVGKKLHSSLKTIAKKHGYDDKLLHNFVIPAGPDLGSDLKSLIIQVISTIK